MQQIQSVIDDRVARPDREPTPIGVVLEALPGGERGSLTDLADRFIEGGLGRIAASSIDHGANRPTSTHVLRRVRRSTARRTSDLIRIPSGVSATLRSIAARSSELNDPDVSIH